MSKQTRRSVLFAAVVVLMLLPFGGLVAEDLQRPDREFPQALGGFYGPFSGSGLHYHRWFGQNGFGVTGGIIYVPFDPTAFWSSSTTLDYTIGGEFQRQVFGDVFTSWLAGSLFVFAGGMHRGYVPVDLIAEGYEVPGSDPPEFVDPVFATGSFQAELTVGVGIGVELIFFRHFSVPMEFGYGATWTPTEPNLAAAFSVGPNLQTGLRYRY